jgi:2-amino-4-hydroxy-6-hydroxymethyldihydropteridine diphosphokinase
VRAYLGLGSNLGDRWAYLSLGARALGRLDPSLVVSPVYETTPVGGPSDQGAYLNAVVSVETDLSPRQLLAYAHEIETEAKRERLERWGPRTLDVDIVVIDGVRVDEDGLTVPHPRMTERAFVLAPLEDIAPQEVPEDWRIRRADQLHSIRKVGYLVPPFADLDESRAAAQR